ncbi:30S ribosomal protein S3 [Candidatus Woesearchaeota archaeon]|jgi:small subunit ribosomal protein S3|nr:30S ribosomal protein S3 [Candidatus Woesearchaeota archaeon]MBT4368715.1 30S ribosomal protein S3 [Candidatus Woesearchaeota archaeon]MBT4712004.1 30S ribosomal protein S3 [Candidatus Woesearchaeota archaeon]MBT6638899.1 30S ribosomal protein S3 [Candidatus Woesearchaeota archaeon]MBT7134543.1 30S ribosomal protein S3 [Candidatus Woesearchaeota archaeon]
MIERKFVSENLKEYLIKEYVNEVLKRAGQSNVKLKKTPLGEKILITASKPGLVVGRKGENIKLLTTQLKKRFNLENPQIEIEEVQQPDLDPKIVAERIATTLERFGSGRFKSIGHKVLEAIMKAGALGTEILISGKIPSSRAKRWRFYQGYLKKSGHIAKIGVLKAYTVANLKSGTVGIQVRIMPGDVELPDKVELREELETIEESEDIKEEEITKKSDEKSSKKKETKKSEPKSDDSQAKPKKKESKKKKEAKK